MNFNTDVIETKQKITEVKYDAVQWIIHDKLTYYLIVQRDRSAGRAHRVPVVGIYIPDLHTLQAPGS